MVQTMFYGDALVVELTYKTVVQQLQAVGTRSFVDIVSVHANVRRSGDYGYAELVIDSLPQATLDRTLRSLRRQFKVDFVSKDELGRRKYDLNCRING